MGSITCQMVLWVQVLKQELEKTKIKMHNDVAKMDVLGGGEVEIFFCQLVLCPAIRLFDLIESQT